MEISNDIIFRSPEKGDYILLDATTTNYTKNGLYQRLTDGRIALKVKILGVDSLYVLPIASSTTLGGIRVGSGLSINPTTGVLSATGGGGGVTSVTSGSLTPLFTVSVANPTTTPVFTFTQVAQTSNLVFASPNGSTGDPTFRALVAADIPSLNYVSSVGATAPLTSSGGLTPNISTSMATNKLIGRSTAGTGVMEEISVGTGLTLSGGALSNSLPFNTPLTTKGDIYTRNATADTRLPVGLDTQMLVADSSTTTGLKWAAQPVATPTGYYAMYQDGLTQTIAVVNTGYPIKFRTLDLSNGVSVVSDSRITFANTGIYNLQFSVQLENSDTQEHDVTIWLRLNGTDVAGSAGFVAVVAKHGGINGHVLPSWNYLLDVVAGQYYEIVWSATSTQVTMPFIPSGSPPPSAASAIFTVTQQAGIMAGTGITAINSLTGASQTLAHGTSGTDFDIVSSGTTHTFNLPIASATNTGKLSNTDWSIFNGKQDLLVSGTNIKTINGSTILGSGDLAVTASNGVNTIRVSGANVTTTSTSASTITGLTITPTANKSYEFWGFLIFSNTTSGGTKFGLSSTSNSIQLNIIAASTANTFASAYTTSQALTGQSFGNNTTYSAYVFGRVVVGANTNAINFQFGVGVGGTSTIFVGSWIKYQEI
jgi:hypothetical protein